MKISTRRQNGFALVLVMVLLATAVVLGMSYLSSASLQVAISDNLLWASRAKYLAESGLQHALYVLQKNPDLLEGSEQNPLGPFNADDTNDSYVFYAVPDIEAGRYLLVSEATVGGVRQRSTMTVVVEVWGEVAITHSVMATAGQTVLPRCVTVNGDFHTNGSILNQGKINGDASACGTVGDPFDGINGEKIPGAQPVDIPTIAWSDYAEYFLPHSTYYAAQTGKIGVFAAGNPLAGDNAITPDNPGGVVQLRPLDGSSDVRLGANLNFKGTLIIDGDVIIDGANIKLEAVRGFPAIVASGEVIITDEADAAIDGVVAATGIAPEGATWGARTTINGALVTSSKAYRPMLKGNHVLNQDPDRSRLYDVSGQGVSSGSVSISVSISGVDQ